MKESDITQLQRVFHIFIAYDCFTAAGKATDCVWKAFVFTLPAFPKMFRIHTESQQNPHILFK